MIYHTKDKNIFHIFFTLYELPFDNVVLASISRIQIFYPHLKEQKVNPNILLFSQILLEMFYKKVEEQECLHIFFF